MSWLPQMLEGIKQNKTRMEIAVENVLNTYAVSRAALRMLDNHEYREAGITDEQFAEWFEASLIGLKTADGEVVIERSTPDKNRVQAILERIRKGYAPEFDVEKIKQAANPKNIDCLWCKYRGIYGRCPKSAFAENRAIGCKNYKAR